MKDTRQAVKLLKDLQEQREPKWEIIQAVLGNGDGSTVNVSGRDGYDYVRLHGLDNELAIAWNNQVASVYDLPVDVRVLRRGKTPIAYEVIGLATGVWTGGSDPYLPTHGETHEYGPSEGYDPVNVYQYALVILRAEPRDTPGMTVRVRHGWYYLNNALTYYAGGISPTFTAPADSGTQRKDLLYLDSTGDLQILTGSTGPSGSTMEPPVPTPLSATVPLAAVLLNDTTTTITYSEITDVRVFINAVGSTGGGGGGGDGGSLWIQHELDVLSTMLAMQINQTLHRAITGLEHEIDALFAAHIAGGV